MLLIKLTTNLNHDSGSHQWLKLSVQKVEKNSKTERQTFCFDLIESQNSHVGFWNPLNSLPIFIRQYKIFKSVSSLQLVHSRCCGQLC